MEKLLGIKPTTCSNYENGVSEPQIQGLIRIANFFEVNLQDLITEDLKEKDGPFAAPQRNRRAYSSNSSSSKLEEELSNLAKEMQQLKADLAAMRGAAQ